MRAATIFVLLSMMLSANAAAQSDVRGASKKEECRIWRLEIRSAKIGTRYNFVVNDLGITTKNHQQHREALSARFLFDNRGKYSLNAAAFSGSGFTSGWDSLGIGSDARSNFRLRELFVSLRPVDQVELQYGGITPIRGVGTEITTYDNDSFIFGTRLYLRSPQMFFFDEISGTLAFVGDLLAPDVFKRMDRYDEANYYQIQAIRKIGQRVLISGDFSSQSGVSTLREAVLVRAPEIKIIHSLLYENYQRIEGKRAYGFAIHGDRRINRFISVGGGFASIDRSYGGWNADRFSIGKRIFGSGKINITPTLSTEIFIQKAVANNDPISNDIRLDLILAYDLMPGIRKILN